jgi:hypothetical protein
LQNCKSSGALKQNSQISTVDLRSNGYRCAHAPWTAPCAQCMGPRWTGRLKRKGTRSWPSARDRTAQDARKRWAAATSPESGGARRGLAGVAPRRRSRPLARPQDGSKRRGNACARVRGVKGGDCPSPAADTGRGRSGRSGKLVGTLLCTKGREKGPGLLLTVACRTSSDGGSGKRSEGAGPRRRRSRRCSGGW